MTRTHMSRKKRKAMHILDLVAAGVNVPAKAVQRALIVTGDALGVQA